MSSRLADTKLAAIAESTFEARIAVTFRSIGSLIANAKDLTEVGELGREIAAQADDFAISLCKDVKFGTNAAAPMGDVAGKTRPGVDADQSLQRHRDQQGQGDDTAPANPTLKQWTDRGYPADKYPPRGHEAQTDGLPTLSFDDAQVTTPWPTVAQAPASIKTGPGRTLQGDKLTLNATNGHATYRLPDPSADPLVLVLVLGSDTYVPRAAA
jgi:hypothetical protein